MMIPSAQLISEWWSNKDDEWSINTNEQCESDLSIPLTSSPLTFLLYLPYRLSRGIIKENIDSRLISSFFLLPDDILIDW